MSGIGRREFLKGLGLATAGLAAPAAAAADDGEPRLERVEMTLPGLDPAHDGLRIAQLTDIHVGGRTPPRAIASAVEQVRRFQPDLVFLTGDFVCHRRWQVAALRDVLAGLEGPVFAVLGNHDHWVDAPGTASSLRSLGYEVLENTWTRITVRGEPLPIVGVGDHLTKNADVARAFKGLDGSSPLVLAHGPRTADVLSKLRRPLACFSGHTHGGQVAVPIFTPLYFWAVGERYLTGRYRVGDVQLYVSRGVGNSGGVRWNAPREVTLATLRARPQR